MAKTLLGIIGSPRRYGNCEIFVKELFRLLPAGEWELQLLRLSELDIRPCKACYQCLFGEMECRVKDDFPFALRALANADAYAVAAPTYLLAANAGLKRFLDRGLSFYGSLDRLWGKPAVAAAIAGIEGMEGAAKLNVESFVKLTMGDLRGAEVIYGALPGEIFLKNGGRASAVRLAEALMHGAGNPEPGTPVCSLCGGDTFRFLPEGRLRCMLCSSTGRYEWGEKGLKVEMLKGEHPLFLTYEDAKEHADWLRGMKDRFMSLRKDLKTVTQEYARTGAWLRPPRDEAPGE